MAFYHRLGKLPKKRHIQFYREDQKTLYREELVSALGFSGIYANKYHIYEPTRIKSVVEIPPAEPLESIRWEEALIQPYHFKTDIIKTSGSFISARNLYLYNCNCRISIAHIRESTDEFFRNAYHHEVIFIHHGKGKLLSEYGQISFGPMDQLVIPKGTIYRLDFSSFDQAKVLIVESDTPFEIPKHYRNEYGQLTEDAPFSERDFRPPDSLDPKDQKGDFPLVIKMGERYFRYTLDHNPLDVVGWDGFLYPYAFNMCDFDPKVGKVHLPPPVHMVFQTRGFVYCNFCPRLFDFHPEAIAVPYNHYNVDSDEVLYYVEGDFMSRKGVGEGSITLHPTGLPHGPQPGKTEESLGKKNTEEYAVMVDTFMPLQVTRNVERSQVADYLHSWIAK